ncbi:hypothetical protein CGRA01v4_09982 [Colletotrichum graminicola]|uniref:Malonyl-CoA:ACP transacylase (MAT) domain-containing protein n=1 Tax=Colletotrichum graminicola (strain M1.001 / M2 / FGSC 10212) TaxID=645133 RepID=E3QHV3_COLGM|nr:uncharacterized protein GLRG_05585 [Colletotrichum graminicola M1.001]EFQ30441.1 hypothetical protein GLRG_05585 [Colletotrichum graminicola M1.001]WDK18697.1 hypothetical protein CGRA01v4_09982 [Colletotrichum graminicola]
MPWVEKALAVDGVQGGMAAVGLGPEQLTTYLVKGVLVGCENSPESTPLTGDKDKLDGVLRRVKEAYPDVLVRELKVDRAYHCHHMRIAAPHYLSYLEARGGIMPQEPSVPFRELKPFLLWAALPAQRPNLKVLDPGHDELGRVDWALVHGRVGVMLY